MLRLIYGAGLRLMECLRLWVKDGKWKGSEGMRDGSALRLVRQSLGGGGSLGEAGRAVGRTPRAEAPAFAR